MEQNLKPIELIVKLVVKTGLYFSRVDGNYDQNEQQFLSNYLKQLEAVGPVDEEVRQMVERAITSNYTQDEIVADTKQLFACFDSADDRQAIAVALFNYIDRVVKADGKEQPAERLAMLKWAQALAE